jgi:hypothetical protein
MPIIPKNWIIGGIAALLVVMAVWAWGNSRYRAGVDDTDKKWVAAGEELKRKAAASATKADDASTGRITKELERAKDEKEKLDAANDAGTSPFDVLFGG